MHAYNLVTGKGTSVLELIHTFERVNNIKVPYKIVERRAGDIAFCYADAKKVLHELQWSTQFGIDEMCQDAWNYESSNSKVLNK